MNDDASRDPHDAPRAERIRRGDRKAFERLFRGQYEALCQFALNYVDRLRVAEDLVQDVFFDLWRERRTLDLKCSLEAYLYGMARNRALKHLRRRRVRTDLTRGELRRNAPRAVPEQADNVLEHQEEEQKAKRAIEALPKRRRQVFMLSRRHDLTYAEIAEALGISVKTVETQMSRALKFLRERLKSFSPR